MDKRSASIVDESSEPLSGTKQCVPVTQLKLKYSEIMQISILIHMNKQKLMHSYDISPITG